MGGAEVKEVKEEEEVETCLTSLPLRINAHEAEAIGNYISARVHPYKVILAFASKIPSDLGCVHKQKQAWYFNPKPLLVFVQILP